MNCLKFDEAFVRYEIILSSNTHTRANTCQGLAHLAMKSIQSDIFKGFYLLDS